MSLPAAHCLGAHHPRTLGHYPEKRAPHPSRLHRAAKAQEIAIWAGFCQVRAYHPSLHGFWSSSDHEEWPV